MSPDWVVSAEARVREWYVDRWAPNPSCGKSIGEAHGVLMWDSPQSDSAWPSWAQSSETAVATVGAPFGYEAVIGDVDPAMAPLPLAQALVTSPEGMALVTPPFVLCAVGHDSMDLFNDALGVGRLFEVQAPGVRVWSNRPVAALLFADIPAVPDPRGWQYAAGCGWFMDDATPYAGTTMMPSGTHVRVDALTRRVHTSRHDLRWDASTGCLDDSVEGVAEALMVMTGSVARLWPDVQPVVDLSGGRDSRLVAAAFLASGVDIVLQTHDGVPGEVPIAQELVSSLALPVEHRILARTTVRQTMSGVGGGDVPPARAPMTAAGSGVLARALAWHSYAEGLRPSSYLPDVPPSRLDSTSALTIGGAGGETAHGHYYPSNVTDWEGLSLGVVRDEVAATLMRRITPAHGASQSTLSAIRSRVHQVIRAAEEQGIEGARLLDAFYVEERLRRWGTTAERLGTVSPLLHPTFVRAALGLSTEERQRNALHKALIRHLVPTWADIPFYDPRRHAVANPSPFGPPPASPGAARPRPTAPTGIAGASDRELVQSALDDNHELSNDFDISAVRLAWRRLLAGTGSPYDEALLRQVVWRSAFDDHVAQVNGKPPPPVPLTRSARSARSASWTRRTINGPVRLGSPSTPWPPIPFAGS